MKYIGNKEADGVLERLLKTEIVRANRAGGLCSRFDADFSAAYIERNLTAGEVARYEIHLSTCPSCRIQVASVARSGYSAEVTEETIQQVKVARRGRTGGLSRALAYLLEPQWIAVATAALVLLAAVPVFVVLKNAKKPGQSASSQLAASPRPDTGAPEPERRLDSKTGGEAPSQFSGFIDSNSSGRPGSEAAPVPSATATFKDGALDGSAAGGKVDQDAAGVARLSDQVPAPASKPAEASPQKTEGENRQPELDKQSESNEVAQRSPQPNTAVQNNSQQNADRSKVTNARGAEEKQTKDQSPASINQASTSAEDKESGARRAEQSAQISPAEAQRLPEDNNKKTGVNVVRPAIVGADTGKAKEGGRQTIRPKDSEPPKTDSMHDENERGRIAKKAPTRDFATRGRSDTESVRKAVAQPPVKGQKQERRVENKRFRLQAGIWTDKDFKSDKEIPAVTLIRDSEVYKSALAKQPGLRAFLAGFAADETVIVVYKHVTYTVLPPKN